MFLALCNAVRLQRHEQFSGHLRTAVLQILLAVCVLQRHKSHWPYASCSATTAPGHLRFQCHKQLAGRLHIAVPQISLAMCVLQRHKSFWPSAYCSATSVPGHLQQCDSSALNGSLAICVLQRHKPPRPYVYTLLAMTVSVCSHMAQSAGLAEGACRGGRRREHATACTHTNICWLFQHCSATKLSGHLHIAAPYPPNLSRHLYIAQCHSDRFLAICIEQCRDVPMYPTLFVF